MIFRQLFDPESSTYTYLLADEVTREAILIDSVESQVARDIKLINELNLKLVYCVETHIHADHVTGAGKLRKETGCKTAVSIHAQVDCADLQLAEGDVIQVDSVVLKALETPGHTNTCLSFYSDGKVFTGDALLIRGCGRTDFQSGDAAQLYDSITDKLFSLVDDVQVYPAHDYNGFTVSSISEEKQHNPRLRLGREGFIDHMNSLVLDDPKKMDVAIPANLACGVSEE